LNSRQVCAFPTGKPCPPDANLFAMKPLACDKSPPEAFSVNIHVTCVEIREFAVYFEAWWSTFSIS
jgi:hypothetical protein